MRIRLCFSIWGLVVVAAVAASMMTAAAGYASVESYELKSAERSIELSSGSAVKVNGDNFFVLNDAGLPELPYQVVNVLLPQGEEVDGFELVYSSVARLAEDYSPVLASPEKTEDGIEGVSAPMVTWSLDSRRFPSTSVVHLGTGYYHGYSIASFAVFPVQMVDGDLVRLEGAALEVSTKVADERPPIVTRERYREGFRDEMNARVRSMVINPEAAAGYVFTETRATKDRRGFHPTTFPSLEGSEVDYVIITNDSLAAAYQTLADWKTAKGVPTVIRTTEWIEANYRNGSDLQETIRNFIVDAYAKWGITYVLLGGDTDQVPARLVWSAYYDSGRFLPADMYYACLDGDWNADGDDVFGEQPPSGTDNPDLYAEIFTGRLPTRNNAQVALVTSKIIDYETPDDDYFPNRILMLAEVLFRTGNVISLDGADFAEYLYQTFFQDPGLDVARLYENYTSFGGSVPESKQAALDSLEVGFDHTIHIGHGFRFNMSCGDASVLNSDADSLSNTPRYTNLYLLNCTAVAYTYFCLAEHYLLAPNGGAVSAIGANESAFPNASAWYMNDYYDRVFLQGQTHIGESFHHSREAQTPSALLGDNVHLWTHYIYTLLADPEMSLWTNQIDTLQVSHPGSVGLGTSTITVTVLDGGSPVDSAMVCLSKGNDDYQYGSTDGAGQATFDFRAESPGQIRVVVTGRNKLRYDGF
ncbi:MAG: C25 family cysteine peptidase, partial [Candidatus Latescibacterota bacterium]